MPAQNPLKYNPSLDGLRAVSILFVLYAHLSMAHFLPVAIRASSLGSSGVILFFVLSGFLITSQLKQEMETSGTISYGRFIGKRAFRLVPAMLLVVLASLLFARQGLTFIAPGSVMHALTYTTNYSDPPAITTLDHLWSLSVEEQFYIVWPLLLLAFGIVVAKRVSFAILFIAPLIRLYLLLSDPTNHAFFRHFESAVDPIAVGCLLALQRPGKRLGSLLSSGVAVLVSLALILASAALSRVVWQTGVLTVSLTALAGGVVIFSLSERQSEVSAILSAKPAVWLGKISYSLYLWQQLFLLAPHPSGPSYLFAFPMNILWALVCATCSYYFFEKPVRDWGRALLARPKRIRVESAVEIECQPALPE